MPDPAPYPGQIKEGARGPAVVAIQGALQSWGKMRLKKNADEGAIRKYGATGDWLKPTTVQLKHFQQLHSIETSGVFGPHTHVAMANWYTPAGRKRLVELEHERKVDAYHAVLVQWAGAIAGHRPDWHYTQGPRRMDLYNRGGDPSIQRDVYGDCSSTVAALIKLACRHVGLPEPDLSPWPTTYSMIGLGRPVGVGHLLPGDRIHYGANSHVGLYIGSRAVNVLSFGGEPGPANRQLEYRPIYACRRDVA